MRSKILTYVHGFHGNGGHFENSKTWMHLLRLGSTFLWSSVEIESSVSENLVGQNRSKKRRNNNINNNKKRCKNNRSPNFAWGLNDNNNIIIDCVWMQTQKSPNDPHIRIRACGCKFHHYQLFPHFKILLDINLHWNQRPLTIWRPTMDINSQHHNLLGNHISPISKDLCIFLAAILDSKWPS